MVVYVEISVPDVAVGPQLCGLVVCDFSIGSIFRHRQGVWHNGIGLKSLRKATEEQITASTISERRYLPKYFLQLL